MSHHHALAPDHSPAPTAWDSSTKPAIPGILFLLLGGIAGLVQLITPWFASGEDSTSGWGEYYSTAHHGATEVIAAYAIVLGALAGLAMIVSAIRLTGRRDDYRATLWLGTLGAVVAIICAAWWLIAGAVPDASQFTVGWYLFLTAGVFGLAGIALVRGAIGWPTSLLLLGGLAAILSLVVPWFTVGDDAVTGWGEYYSTAHHGVGDTVAAYAIIVALIAGVVLVLAGLGITLRLALPRASRLPGRLPEVALTAGAVLLLAAVWWFLAGDAPSGSTFSFGWYLFIVSGALGIIGALAHGAAGVRLETAPTLVLLAGVAGIAQLGLPWFNGATGWATYYRTPHDGWTAVVSAYLIIVGLLAGIALTALGVAMLARPAAERQLARIARVAAIVILVCVGWWILFGPEKFATTIAAGGFGWYLLVLAGLVGLTGAAIPLASARLTFDKASFMVAFLGVPLAIFLIFVVSPFIQAIYYSLTDWKGYSADMNFVGFHNYVKLFHDDKFRQALVNCIELGIVVPLVTIVLALAIASMVTVGGPSRGPVRGLKASSFYRVVSFFPYTVPAIVIGIIWANVYHPSSGIVNSFLTTLGFDKFENFGWLGRVSTAMPASMFVIIWSFVGFYAVLFIAAIKGVSAEVYEAAKLDGAGRFRTAVSVTIPLIRDTIQTAYIYIGIAALDSFVYMMALNASGGPDYSTLTMSQDLYQTAFKKGQFGYATSMGVILAIVTLLFATIVFLVNHWASNRNTPKTRRRDAKAITAPLEGQAAASMQAGVIQ